MKEHRTSGIIVLKDELGIEYRICRIDYIQRSDDTFTYIFTPDYRIIDLLDVDNFQGIPGLALETGKEQFVRENITPTFISERSPSENREDLWELLESVGMDHLNRLEWLIRTDSQYFGDNMYVIRYDESEERRTIGLSTSGLLAQTSCIRILKEICAGNDVILKDMKIDDSNRLEIYHLLHQIAISNAFSKTEMRRNGKTAPAGRKKKTIDLLDIEQAEYDVENGTMTYEEAAKKLGISRSTLYRRLKDQHL